MEVCGSHKVAVLVARDGDVSAVQQQLSPFVHPTLDKVKHPLFGRRGDKWAKVSIWGITCDNMDRIK